MKPLVDLANNDCRWPVTDTKPFQFCAEPRIEGSSYCRCHKAMSVSPEQPIRPGDGAADVLAGSRLVGRAKASASTQRMPVDQHMKINRCASRTSWGIE